MTATDIIAKALGILAGLALAAVLLTSWRVSSPAAAPGAEVVFTTAPPGELTVARKGPLMRGRDLRSGAAAISGRAELRNVAGRRLVLRARLAPSNRDLDRLLRVELRAGARRLAAGTLGALRRWSPRTAQLGAGRSTPLTARAWLPRGTGRAAAGRFVDVTVELRATVRGRTGR